MQTTQEEAGTIIVRQVAGINDGTVHVVADDTDIFLLLLYFCNRGAITCSGMMISPVAGREVVDIKETANKHQEIIPNILQAHGLDTVPCCFGIGKATGLKVLKSGKSGLDCWV